MPQLELRLLGSFRLDLDNTALTGFHSDKVRALLAYLVLETGDGPVRRDVLTSLLWDGYTAETARHSLRTALHNLRRVCAPLPLLATSRQAAQFDRSHPGFWCDALALEALLCAVNAASDKEQAAQRAAWLAELEIYQAAFLDGLNLTDSPSFEAWKTAKRANYAERIAAARQALRRAAAKRLPGVPRSLTPFFGRERDLGEIGRRVVDPDYPLITVVGEGGIGKTRLALEVARQVNEYFADGVWFVSLVDVRALSHADSEPSTPGHEFDRLAVAIGQSIQMAFGGGSSPVSQLLAYLRDKELLLVLDNFEHLVPAAGFVADLVQAAKGVTLLITSRQRLDLQMEWIYRLQGLPVPERPPASASAKAQPWSSLQLFAERAARRLDGLALDDEDWPHVVDICRSVEGLPLAIELAAALVDQRSCREIARSISRNTDLLATTMQDVPSRHRSVRAAFEYSWQSLSPAQARSLAQCSVFRGGFDREAAVSIMAITPDRLTALLDRSLIRQDDAGRYDMHSLISQLAAQHLATDPHGDRQKTLARHSAFYLTWVGDQEAAIFRNDKDTLRLLRLEFENIRQAWKQALADGADDLIDHSMIAIYEYCHLEGLIGDATDLFAAAIDQIRRSSRFGSAGQGHGLDQVLSGLLALYASFLQPAGQRPAADAAIHEALQLAHTAKARALALLNSAELMILRAAAGPEAIALLEDALVQARAWPHPVIEAMILHRLANAHFLSGRLGASRQVMQQTLQAYSALGDVAGMAAMLVNLGALSLTLLEDVHEIRRYVEQALELQEAAGNRQIETIGRINLSAVYLIEGEYLQALEQAAAALALASNLRHRRFQALAFDCLGQVYATLGDLASAEAHCGESLARARLSGHTGQQAEALRGMADLRLRAGDHEAARQLAQELHSLAADSLPPRFVGDAWRLLGHVHTARQDLASAAAAYQQAVQAYDASTHRYLQMESLAGLAEVALAEDRLADAQGYVERIFAWWQPARLAANQQPERIYLAVYRVLQASNDPRAVDVLRQAQAFLQERAARLPDAAMRQRYLEATGHRQEIIRLAQSMR